MPQIATILLLLHLGVGCCWHHAHSVATSTGRAICWHDHNRAEPGHSHEHDRHAVDDEALAEHHEGDHQGDEQHGPCDDDRCTYVRGETVEIPSVLLAGGWIHGLLSPADASAACDGFVSANHATRFECDASLSVRAHLLFGILLI
jgi:hypothetical protein